ncbi:hypothetical protein BDV41DRAFT_573446 [Aspergillus transmontanensis]|uniref:Uncharacterized protein n=1 Tax=Aspergillus transmontanensis TaxID=1034304 RepID=A0A5N6W954_9EURO|nr:hypothetical protein BDV41DRAFT_573446 [Aspergillus transmontanensis]
MTSLKPLHAYNLRVQQPQRLQVFGSNLRKALDTVTPTAQVYYRDVSVLALHWQNDDMGVNRLESELLNIFAGVYNFRTESYQIPVLRSGRANAAGCLVGPSIDWGRISGVIDTEEGDAPYIFDCCSAASVAMETGPETIAASGWEQTATANLRFSLTQVFINTLNDLRGSPETVAGIYARLFRNAYQNQIGACPVHIPKEGSPIITPQKLQPREVQRLQTSKAYGSIRVLISVN